MILQQQTVDVIVTVDAIVTVTADVDVDLDSAMASWEATETAAVSSGF